MSALVRDIQQETTPPRARPSAPSPTRSERRHDFELFLSVAAGWFRNPPEDPRHQRMVERNGFHVAPALREAKEGADPRAFEAYYGDRDVVAPRAMSNMRLRSEWRDEREAGAALLYRQGEDGAVTVVMHPARADGWRADEDAIVLGRLSDTAPLTGEGIVGKHWRAFRAYAEVTSIDGEPSFTDQLRVAWLRFCKATLKDGAVRPAKISQVAGASAGVGVAIGAVALATALLSAL